ncbi:MAG: AraC family transcriptional regulator [Ginsengibacter sp.]
MEEIHYEFIDLDSEASFQLFGKSLGAILRNTTLYFDNYLAKGELVKATPDEGLWIRKWKFTVLQKVLLHKLPAPPEDEKKFILIYFLNPSIFMLRTKRKKILVNGRQNNMFLTSGVTMDFSVVPKQPFYALDVAFTASWLLKQFSDADTSFKNILNKYLNKDPETIFIEPCSVDEYKILHELEESMSGNHDDLFIRSRGYNLVLNFFSKVENRKEAKLLQSAISYEQMVQAEMIIMENIKSPPKIETIARKVNMSVSSLLRQFKLIFGKSTYQYYVEKKMEIAKKMILENGFTVKEMAEMLGYNQASPFIECFTKYHGYSPGSLKSLSY